MSKPIAAPYYNNREMNKEDYKEKALEINNWILNKNKMYGRQGRKPTFYAQPRDHFKDLKSQHLTKMYLSMCNPYTLMDQKKKSIFVPDTNPVIEEASALDFVCNHNIPREQQQPKLKKRKAETASSLPIPIKKPATSSYNIYKFRNPYASF